MLSVFTARMGLALGDVAIVARLLDWVWALKDERWRRAASATGTAGSAMEGVR